MRRLAITLCTLLALAGCSTEIDRSISFVDGPRILAVRAEPAESLPDGTVIYSALAVTSTGPKIDAPIDWSFCTSPALPGEDGSVSSECVVAAAASVAIGNDVALGTPADACRRFGPLGMPTKSGKAPTQPPAPDASGGYSQPVRLVWNATLTFAFERLTCAPVGISLDLAQAYRNARAPNLNPQLLPASDLGVATAGSAVSVSAAWTPESRDSYLTVDVQQGVLMTNTEKLWLAWFVTGGTLAHDFAVAEVGETSTTNEWRLPDQSGTYYLWTVLHDSRGGVDFSEAAVVVP